MSTKHIELLFMYIKNTQNKNIFLKKDWRRQNVFLTPDPYIFIIRVLFLNSIMFFINFRYNKKPDVFDPIFVVDMLMMLTPRS